MRIFGLTSKYQPQVCVQQLGMIKGALTYKIGKNKNSSLREENDSKDSARCFQGSESEAS